MGKKRVIAEDEFPSWPVQILAGFILMVIHQAIVIPIAVFYSQMVALGFGALLGMFIIIGGSMSFGPSLIFAGILAISVSCTGGMFFFEYHLAAKGPIAKNVSIGEIHQLQEAKVWFFIDGQPRREFEGVSVSRSRSKDGSTSTNYYYVVPVVHDYWKKSQEVPLWAVARNRRPGSWKIKAGVGLAANPVDLDHYRSAVKDAKKKHGLLTFPDLHLVEWVESYEEELAERWNIAKYFVITFNALWFIGMALAWLYYEYGENEESE